ncbi:GMC family oxidoreductase [bacterium]|nr:GMC family oxidoreductase [bacterium]
MGQSSAVPNVLGNTSLDRFDAVIVGSGAGGSAAAYVLTSAGKNALILEAGDNNFPGLDDPAPGMPVPRYGNDELKAAVRLFDRQDPILEPRTFRVTDAVAAQPNEDVNILNRTVGGTTVHADMKYPRFNDVDFRLASALSEAGRLPADASFIDWPLTYDELEPWYTEAERITGVAGIAGDDPFASWRSGPYPMPPSPEMYVGRLLSAAARQAGYTPFHYPAAINSRPYPAAPALQRPPCVNCGFCSGFGCPNNAKSSAAVTTLRAALLSGRCQLRFNCHVRRLLAAGRRVSAVEYVDPSGAVRTASGDHVILAASAMESVRLALLSDLALGDGPAYHLGRHMLFHYQTNGVGIFKQRIHGERGQAVTNGISDFRGVAEGGTALHPDGRPLAGIVEFGTSSEPISTAKSSKQALDVAANIPSIRNVTLKQLLVESPFHAHIAVMIVQAEDAPQATNRVDLDPDVRDVFGLPVVRLTYANHRFELDAAEFYKPKLVEIMRLAGAQFGFIDPSSGPPRSRHVLGGLRMGSTPDESVTDAYGRFHGFDNLHCMDGGVMPTGSGYNPTLTLIALALRAAAHIADPESPERRIGQGPL